MNYGQCFLLTTWRSVGGEHTVFFLQMELLQETIFNLEAHTLSASTYDLLCESITRQRCYEDMKPQLSIVYF
jgi:hypothetical protein